MAGVEREGKGGENKKRLGRKERDLSSFLVRAFLPLGSPFSGDCLYSAVVKSSDETNHDYIRNLVPTVLSDSALLGRVGEDPGKEVGFTRGA